MFTYCHNLQRLHYITKVTVYLVYR